MPTAISRYPPGDHQPADLARVAASTWNVSATRGLPAASPPWQWLDPAGDPAACAWRDIQHSILSERSLYTTNALHVSAVACASPAWQSLYHDHCPVGRVMVGAGAIGVPASRRHHRARLASILAAITAGGMALAASASFPTRYHAGFLRALAFHLRPQCRHHERRQLIDGLDGSASGMRAGSFFIYPIITRLMGSAATNRASSLVALVGGAGFPPVLDHKQRSIMGPFAPGPPPASSSPANRPSCRAPAGDRLSPLPLILPDIVIFMPVADLVVTVRRMKESIIATARFATGTHRGVVAILYDRHRVSLRGCSVRVVEGLGAAAEVSGSHDREFPKDEIDGRSVATYLLALVMVAVICGAQWFLRHSSPASLPSRG